MLTFLLNHLEGVIIIGLVVLLLVIIGLTARPGRD